ncbi:MAG: TatD family hydrolase [Prevotella sp.]|nr:TatD family hydrolase [Prevotella sp.]MBR6190417.1 TatD family hydrolase [Prevotella sp.]
MEIIDTHCHLDGEEYNDDRAEVIARAVEAGVMQMFVPAIDLPSSRRIIELCQEYPGTLYPMVGLHPEEVRADWREVLQEIRQLLPTSGTGGGGGLIAIGEVGLDFYWSREFEQEQMLAFEEQVRWSIETRLPLMIHCRKAQNEMVAILKRYQDDLPGGVFHCFTGNEIEAQQLLEFPRFVLGIGGVSTFKKSHLPEVLPAVVPLDRIVLETDSPYMAPVPHRGQRNEPAFVVQVLARLAQAYGISEEEMADRTNENVARVFFSE